MVTMTGGLPSLPLMLLMLLLLMLLLLLLLLLLLPDAAELTHTQSMGVPRRMATWRPTIRRQPSVHVHVSMSWPSR